MHRSVNLINSQEPVLGFQVFSLQETAGLGSQDPTVGVMCFLSEDFCILSTSLSRLPQYRLFVLDLYQHLKGQRL